jgi:hypothetical protein
VLKCIREKVVQQGGDNYLDAVANSVEDAYLLSATLNHPLILKLRGVVCCDTASISLRNGQDAGYWLLLDNLDGGILDEKLQEWATVASCHHNSQISVPSSSPPSSLSRSWWTLRGVKYNRWGLSKFRCTTTKTSAAVDGSITAFTMLRRRQIRVAR